uniref:Uncharacterized protein n=1 Tax=Pseudictyota dubia TaxID=2749911 RepID=A0A7R9WKM4_9STRA
MRKATEVLAFFPVTLISFHSNVFPSKSILLCAHAGKMTLCRGLNQGSNIKRNIRWCNIEGKRVLHSTLNPIADHRERTQINSTEATVVRKWGDSNPARRNSGE